MRIGASIDVDQPFEQVVAQVQGFADAGLHSAWASQIFGYDPLTLFAALGPRVPGIDLGTGVVPVYGRHPQPLAQQALTVQAVTGGRLLLGVGLSHQVVVEGLWGYSYDRPARYMAEYLSALDPLLHGGVADVAGEVVTAHTYAPLSVPDAPAPSVLVAALGPTMLRLAGRMTDGTVTWMTGMGTVGSHIVPTITAAAEAAGRPQPRVVVSLPVVVTGDPDAVAAHLNDQFAIYPTLPSYKAMLDKEGATKPSDVALIGSEEEVAADLSRLADAGATDVVAAIVGPTDDRRRTQELLAGLASA